MDPAATGSPLINQSENNMSFLGYPSGPSSGAPPTAQAGTDAASDFENMSTVNVAAGFVNDQVGKFQKLATEGPLTFRVLALLGGVAMIVVSVLDWIGEIFRFSLIRGLISVYCFIFGVFIIILEGKMFVPQTAKYQQKLFSYAKVLRFVWGRGVFYFFAGSLQLSQMGILDILSGGFMCFVGIISILTGRSTANKLKKVRNSMADESIMREKFKLHDLNQDNFLDHSEFAALVSDIGLELNHNELLAAFEAIDKDEDKQISMDEFSAWWTVFQSDDATSNVSLLI